MINGVENQTLMLRIGRQVGFIEQSLRNHQRRLAIARALFGIALLKIIAQSQQSLRADGRGGTIHRFEIVERVGGFVQPITQLLELRRARVPVGNAVLCSLLDVVVAA